MTPPIAEIPFTANQAVICLLVVACLLSLYFTIADNRQIRKAKQAKAKAKAIEPDPQLMANLRHWRKEKKTDGQLPELNQTRYEPFRFDGSTGKGRYEPFKF